MQIAHDGERGNLNTETRQKIAKMVMLFSSDRDEEVLAAVRGIGRMLGGDWHKLAALICGDGLSTIADLHEAYHEAVEASAAAREQRERPEIERIMAEVPRCPNASRRGINGCAWEHNRRTLKGLKNRMSGFERECSCHVSTCVWPVHQNDRWNPDWRVESARVEARIASERR